MEEEHYEISPDFYAFLRSVITTIKAPGFGFSGVACFVNGKLGPGTARLVDNEGKVVKTFRVDTEPSAGVKSREEFL